MSISPGKLAKIDFSGYNFRLTLFRHLLHNLPFTAKFWANYSISLEKSPLSNITSGDFLYMIRYNNVSRPSTTACDRHDPSPKSGGRNTQDRRLYGRPYIETETIDSRSQTEPKI